MGTEPGEHSRNHPRTSPEQKDAQTQQLSGKKKTSSALPSLLAFRKIHKTNKVLHTHFIQLYPGLKLLQDAQERSRLQLPLAGANPAEPPRKAVQEQDVMSTTTRRDPKARQHQTSTSGATRLQLGRITPQGFYREHLVTALYAI